MNYSIIKKTLTDLLYKNQLKASYSESADIILYKLLTSNYFQNTYKLNFVEDQNNYFVLNSDGLDNSKSISLFYGRNKIYDSKYEYNFKGRKINFNELPSDKLLRAEKLLDKILKNDDFKKMWLKLNSPTENDLNERNNIKFKFLRGYDFYDFMKEINHSDFTELSNTIKYFNKFKDNEYFFVLHNDYEIVSLLNAFKYNEYDNNINLSYISTNNGFIKSGYSKIIMNEFARFCKKEELIVIRSSVSDFAKEKSINDVYTNILLENRVPFVSNTMEDLHKNIFLLRDNFNFEDFCDIYLPIAKEWEEKYSKLEVFKIPYLDINLNNKKILSIIEENKSLKFTKNTFKIT